MIALNSFLEAKQSLNGQNGCLHFTRSPFSDYGLLTLLHPCIRH